MDPTTITAHRAGRPEQTTEAELVLVSVDDDVATLTLDDGERLTFHTSELRAALGTPHALRDAA